MDAATVSQFPLPLYAAYELTRLPRIAFMGGLDLRRELPPLTVEKITPEPDGSLQILVSLVDPYAEIPGTCKAHLYIASDDKSLTYDQGPDKNLFRSLATTLDGLPIKCWEIFASVSFFMPLFLMGLSMQRLRPLFGEEVRFGPYGNKLRNALKDQLDPMTLNRFDRALENTWRTLHRV